MSRNNTGNPIGSKAFPDFEDNVKNLDDAVNSDELEWVDRLGQSRRTLAGVDVAVAGVEAAAAVAIEQTIPEIIADTDAEANAILDTKESIWDGRFQLGQDLREQQFAAFIASSGYQFSGDYATGIEVTQYNQVLRDENGEFWRVSGPTQLPYITTGAGLPESGALIPVGDATARQAFQKGQLRSTNYTTDRNVRKAGLNSHTINLTRERKRPVISFIDDDGAKSYMTKFKPLFDAKGFKAAVAIPTGRINSPGSTGMNWDDIRQLYDEGYEILSHTHNNLNLGTITPEEAEQEFIQSRFEIESRGMEVESFVPVQGGGGNAEIDRLVRKYFRASFQTREEGIQYKPLQDYRVCRFNIVNSPEQDNPTLQQLKDLVDYAVANNEWVVFTSHADYTGATPAQMEVVADLLDYIELNGVEVLTPSKALDIHGSKINIGDDRDPFAPDPPPYFKVTAEGEVYPRKVVNLIDDGSITTSTPITDFEPNCMTIITSVSGSTFGIGTVETYRGIVGAESVGFQRRIVDFGLRMYYRVWIRSAQSWTDWTEVQQHLPLYQGYIQDASKPITDYPENLITHGYTRNNNPDGLPDVVNTDGTLMTVRSGASGGTHEGFQIWTPSDSRLVRQKWMRNWRRVPGEWSDWFRIDSHVNPYDGDLEADLPLSDQNMILSTRSYTTATASAAGFIPSAGTIYGFAHQGVSRQYGAMQLFTPLRSNSMRMRHWNDSNNQWSDWEVIAGGATGTFTTADSKTVTVTNGIITGIS